jgi:DNA-binding beta-propeller fold protein YncE
VTRLLLILTTLPLAAPAGADRRIGDRLRVGGDTFIIWDYSRTGIMPKGASISPDGKRLYVTNFGRREGKNISVFDAEPLRHRRNYSYPGNAIESVVSPDGRALFATNKIGGTLDAVDTEKGALIKRYPVGGFPKFILLDTPRNQVYLSLWTANKVARLSLASGRVDRLDHGERHPRGLALSQDGKLLFVANNGGRHVTVIDTAEFKVKKRVRVPGRPRHATLSRDGRYVYVAAMGSHALGVINVKKLRLVRFIYVGNRPKSIEESYDGRFVYTANYGGHSMTVVDTGTWRVKELPLDLHKSSGLVVHPSDRYIYVTGWCSNDVWAVRRFKEGEEVERPATSHPRRRVCRECPSKLMECPRKDRKGPGRRASR